MALQTPLTQEQLIAQALGAQAQAGGIPGQMGMPAPTGMPGAPVMPAMDAQLLAQALGGGTPQVNPMQTAGMFDWIDPGSQAGYIERLQAWRMCNAQGRDDCGPQPARENPLPAPPPAQPVRIGT